ncbi:YtzC family protein [Peribacillus tepidiphilus]|uniref:YtzC family protein n=1 Tax=Peribacillus tepidiphilus TaxID=2652445 RepID=UPI0012920E22|nr:YtzC family protein [Peribacillus tepidiphilus]
MATRASIDHCLQNCEDVLRNAQEQYKLASKQEHYNDDSFLQCQQQLESAYNEIQKLAHSSNDQQREQLNRMRMQIMKMQSSMSHLRH